MMQPAQGGGMTSPIAGLQYFELAEEFYQAFRDWPPNGPSGIPVSCLDISRYVMRSN
jgi:hypothetical protein